MAFDGRTQAVVRHAYTTATDAVLERAAPQDAQSGERRSFWRKDAPIFDDNNKIVSGGMFEHQRSWYDLPNFIKLLVGGYGAGKTISAAKRAIALALHNAPCPGAVVSPTYGMARETTIATIQGLLQGKKTLLGRRFYWNWNASSHQFHIIYRGRDVKFTVYSGDNPQRLKGPNLAWAIIDEPFIQSKDVFEQIVARVRHPDAAHKEIGLTGTPEELNWGYDLVEGDLADDYDVGYVRASTKSNLALDSSYYDRLLSSMDELTASAYLEGHFTNLSKGLVYHAFDPKNNIVNMGGIKGIPDGVDLGVGMDFNVDPMAAVAFWRHKNRIHIFKEYERPNSDTEDMCQQLREDFGDRLEYIYPDATGARRSTAAPGGLSDFHYIRSAGFEIMAHKGNPRVRDREAAANGKFKSRKGKTTLTIDSSCKKLRKYLSLYSHEKRNKPEQKAMSHLLDAMGYPVYYLYPVGRKEFQIKRMTGV